MPAKYVWLHMGDSFEFSHAFRFRSEQNELLLTGEANFFLAKPYLSSLHAFVQLFRAKIFAFREQKNTRGINPLGW